MKHYNPQGKWRRHRLASSTSFIYSHYNRQKKAKLEPHVLIDEMIFATVLGTDSFSQENGKVYNAKAENKYYKQTDLEGIGCWHTCLVKDSLVDKTHVLRRWF
jgi:hypothetical protein